MSAPALFSGRARQEIATTLREMEHASAAEELRQAVENAARRLGRHPSLGRLRPYMPATYRLWLLSRSRYALVYDPATDPVEILRFVHTRRDLPRVLADLPSGEYS